MLEGLTGIIENVGMLRNPFCSPLSFLRAELIFLNALFGEKILHVKRYVQRKKDTSLPTVLLLPCHKINAY